MDSLTPSETTLATTLRAAVFAARIHAGHRRKGSAAEPYVNHVLEVAEILATHGAPHAAIVAALLHDTVEDSDEDPEPCTLEHLEAAFGPEVAGIVAEVSDDKSLPKEVRKGLQVRHAPKASDGGEAAQAGRQDLQPARHRRQPAEGLGPCAAAGICRLGRPRRRRRRGRQPGARCAVRRDLPRRRAAPGGRGLTAAPAGHPAGILADIAALERACLTALPAPRHAWDGAFVLKAFLGGTGRANACCSLDPAPDPGLAARIGADRGDLPPARPDQPLPLHPARPARPGGGAAGARLCARTRTTPSSMPARSPPSPWPMPPCATRPAPTEAWMALIATAEYQTPARRAEKLRNPDLLAAPRRLAGAAGGRCRMPPASSRWRMARIAGSSTWRPGRNTAGAASAPGSSAPRRTGRRRLAPTTLYAQVASSNHASPRPAGEPRAARGLSLPLLATGHYRASAYRALSRGSAAAFSTSRSSTARTRRGSARPPGQTAWTSRGSARQPGSTGTRRPVATWPITPQGASSARPSPASAATCVVSIASAADAAMHGDRGGGAVRPFQQSAGRSAGTPRRTQNSWAARSSGVSGIPARAR